MKKIITGILLIIVVLTMLFSCRTPSTTTDTTQNTEANSTEPSTEVTTSIEEETETMNEKILYNGIELPKVWPPTNVSTDYKKVIDIPYLKEINNGGTHPEVVNINVGRQLFVDNFLIDTTNLTTTYHEAVPYENNPVLVPNYTRTYGTNLKHGACYYDEEKKIYQLWYTQNGSLLYHTSKDGIQWSDPYKCLSVSGYATVVKNPDAKTTAYKYILLVRPGNSTYDKLYGANNIDHNAMPYKIYYSANGMTWFEATEGGSCGDATTLFYNPFRKKWCVSIRKNYSGLVRCREYFECDDIIEETPNSELFSVFWLRADQYDIKDSVVKMNPQIYSVSAVAYESIMLAGIQMFVGPENAEAEKTGIPKITNIHLAYSRDGFYYYRPSREPILESSQVADTWDRGYLHQVSTICVVHEDELWFYYSGYKGNEARAGDGVANSGTLDYCSIGLAKMRRDGFASLDGTGTVLTRKMTCTKGQKYLFVNAKAKSLKAEILDENGKVISGYSLNDCIAFSGDSTCTMITWKNGKTISDLNKKTFSIRFKIEDGEFYSFWVSATEDGDSNGYYAGGLVQ